MFSEITVLKKNLNNNFMMSQIVMCVLGSDLCLEIMINYIQLFSSVHVTNSGFMIVKLLLLIFLFLSNLICLMSAVIQDVGEVQVAFLLIPLTFSCIIRL